MFTNTLKKGSFIIIAATIGLSSCATISKFDQYSYAQSTSLKVDVMNVMSEATDSFALHQTEIAQVKTSLTKMYEYERSKPKNTITEKMWSIIVDSTGNSVGGFFTRWQKEKKLDAAFINASKTIIGQSFDQVSQLESGKIKTTTAAN